MTNKEIENLCGDDLDTAVARALGWILQTVVNQFDKAWFLPTSPRGKLYPGDIVEAGAWRLTPRYSQSPDAVFQLLHEIKHRMWSCELDLPAGQGWTQMTARIVTNPDAYPADPQEYMGFGGTLGEAVCKAFLFADNGRQLQERLSESEVATT